MPGYGASVRWFFFLSTGSQTKMSLHVKNALWTLVGKDNNVSDIRTALATYAS